MFHDTDNFTIVGDGKMLAIIVGETAYVINDPILKECSISQDRPMINIQPLPFGYDRELCDSFPGLWSAEVQLTIVPGGEIKTVPAKEIQLQNVDNMSVIELLSHINKKLEKR